MKACFLFIVTLMLLHVFGTKIVEAVSTRKQPNAIQHSLEKISTNHDGSICTTNGTDYVLFSDQNQLDKANKKKEPTEAAFIKVAKGFCQTHCILICPIISEPLCAHDTTTGIQRSFNNQCEMSRDACLNDIPWKLLASGPCSSQQQHLKSYFNAETKTSDTKRIPVPCIGVFNPVCATFAGVKSTFNNECLMNAENVKTGSDWVVVSSGVCAEDSAAYNLNSDQLKHNSIRSYDEKLYQDKQQPIERYFDDTTFIYTPPIVKTEYVDESPFPNNYRNPTTVYQQPANSLINGYHNELDRMQICKYGSEPVCGIYRNIYRAFDNVCELMMRNYFLNETWTTTYAGNCITNNCHLKCTKKYAPICVSRDDVNVTISNFCILEKKMCQNPKSTWKILANGECNEEMLPAISNIKAKSLGPLIKPNALESRMETAPQTAPISSNGSINNEAVTTTITPTVETIFIIRRRTTPAEEAITTTTAATTATSTEAPKTEASSDENSTPDLGSTIRTTTSTVVPTKTTIAESNSQPTTPKSSTTVTMLPKSTASLKFDTWKSITTPKHYVSLTTSEATTPTAPITLNPQTKSTTNAPISTFVISAKSAPAFTSLISIYGPNRNSLIMRLIKAKAFTSPKYTLARGFSKPTEMSET